jgi:hypothetical protein
MTNQKKDQRKATVKRGKLPLIVNMDFNVIFLSRFYWYDDRMFWTTSIHLDKMFWTSWILFYFWSTIMFYFFTTYMSIEVTRRMFEHTFGWCYVSYFVDH